MTGHGPGTANGAPAVPPDGYPQILVSSTGASSLVASRADQVVGQPFADVGFRDVVVDCVVTPVRASPTTAFGMYVRQSVPDRYVLWTVTAQRRFRVGLVDGGYHAVHDATLGDDVPLHDGARTRLTTVAVGPSLTFIVNGVTVTGVMVSPRFADGLAGAWLQCADSTGAELVVEWAQVRQVVAGLG